MSLDHASALQLVLAARGLSPRIPIEAGDRPSPSDARSIVHRLVASHFGNGERAYLTRTASPGEDDRRLLEFIRCAEADASRLEALDRENHSLRADVDALAADLRELSPATNEAPPAAAAESQPPTAEPSSKRDEPAAAVVEVQPPKAEASTRKSTRVGR